MTKDFYRVRAYLRYSSHNQDDGYSIEYQTTEIQEFAKKNGFEIEKMHIDQAQTATKTAGRDEFFALMDAVKRDEVDAIVVYKTSRIFRNSYESHKYRNLFIKHNVKFISATQTIDESTPEGRFMASTISNVDQYQSETTSDHVKSSMREMARQGYYTGGRVLFGYELETFEHGGRMRKKYKPNKEQAEIVKMIFEMFTSGNSVVEIMNYLVRKNIRTKQGNFFSEPNIYKMLKNDAYIGTVRYRVEGQDEIVTENAHEPIINRELWNNTQETLKTLKRIKPRKKKYYYALTGKILCGCCGTHFIGSPSNSTYKGKKYVYHSYVCRQKRKFRACENKQIKKDTLEKTVLAAIKRNILNPAQIEQITVEMMKQFEKSPISISEKIKEMNTSKKDIIKKLNVLIDMRMSGEINGEIVKMRSIPLENELKEIEKNLFALEQQKKQTTTSEEIQSFLYDMLSKTENLTDKVLKQLFDCFVENIIITTHEIKIKLRVFPAPDFAYKNNIATPIVRLYAEIDK